MKSYSGLTEQIGKKEHIASKSGVCRGKGLFASLGLEDRLNRHGYPEPLGRVLEQARKGNEGDPRTLETLGSHGLLFAACVAFGAQLAVHLTCSW